MSKQFLLDGQPVPFEDGQTILEAARAAGHYIPSLCWHKDFPPHGSCKLCVVKAAGRHVSACATPAKEGWEVESNSPEMNGERRGLLQPGGTIIEAHLRFADQWCDLYGEGWAQALVRLYTEGRWQFGDDARRDGYSVPLFARHGGPFRHPPAVGAVAITKDGKIGITSGRDQVVRVWNVETGEAIAAMPHNSFVEVLALAPDDETLATFTEKGDMRVWRFRTGEGLTPAIRHGTGFAQARVSDDGKEVLFRLEKLGWFTMPMPVQDAVLPEWFLRFAETLAGNRVTPTGRLEELDITAHDAALADVEEAGRALAEINAVDEQLLTLASHVGCEEVEIMRSLTALADRSVRVDAQPTRDAWRYVILRDLRETETDSRTRLEKVAAVYRDFDNPTNRDDSVGFRCLRTP